MADTSIQPDAPGLYCPHCGYDLRGAGAPRCPECGSPFQWEELQASRIPWVYRKKIGRIRALAGTVSMALRTPGAIAQERAAPIDWQSANGFCRAVVATVAIVISLLLAILYPWIDLSTFSARLDPGASGSLPVDLYPLVVLWTGPGILALICGTIFVAGAAVGWWIRVWFWVFGGTLRDRASALACYASAWWVPAGALAAFSLVAAVLLQSNETLEKTVGDLDALVFVLLGVCASVWITFLFQRTTNRGWITSGICGGLIGTGAAATILLSALAVCYTFGFIAILAASVWGK